MLNIIRGLWRFFQPMRNCNVLNPFLYKGYLYFLLDLNKYNKLKGGASFKNIAPILKNKHEPQTGGGHYFYQDIWALHKVKEINPGKIIDIGAQV